MAQAAAVEQAICGAGAVPVTVDSCGNPLDVGREQRLFTARQRIALAVRDGAARYIVRPETEEDLLALDLG